jgi:hypothetical protein
MTKQIWKLTLLSALIACACSTNEERDYSIPNPLCGVELNSALYDPIFPSGDEVNVSDLFRESGGNLLAAGECIAEVDGEQAIFIDLMGSDSNRYEQSGIAEYLDSYRDRNGDTGAYRTEDAERVTQSPHETWVWSDFAATSIACASSRTDLQTVNVSIRLDWFGDESFGDEDYSEALAELIGPFADEVVRQIGERYCASS